MANITRIKNNQITDSTIEYTKIKPGTLTGSVFNPNLTFNSNITVLGNLSVTGTSATINSTDTYVNDPLIVFNNGYVGSPSYDIGIVANRNLGSLAPYGSVNTAFVWSESDDAWIAIATTETGGTKGSLNNSGWANLKVGNLTSVTSTVNGALSVTGGTTLSSTLGVTGATTLTTATIGGLQAVAIGNVTPGTGAFTTLSATSFVNSGNLVITSTTDTTDVNSGALMVAGGASIVKKVMVGIQANTTRFPNASVVVSSISPSIQQNESLYIGLLAEAVGQGGIYAAGVYGIGYTSGTGRGTGVIGEAHVSATGDAFSAIGVRGYSNDTHAGSNNIGIYAEASNSATGNYALWMQSGSINSASAQNWTLMDNQASALSIDATGKSGILKIVTTDAAEGVTMSGTLSVTGATTLTTATVGGLQAVAIGNATPGTGAFTTLTSSSTIIASGNIVAASGTASTNTTSGALVVAGGAGISGAVYAGSLYDNGNRVLTSFSSTGAGNVTVSINNPTSSTVELTATGPGAAQWGGTTQLPVITTDAYGRVSAASNIALNTVAVTNLGNTTEITANATVGLTGLSLTDTGVTAGNYGSATIIPTIVVDSKGRVTSLTTNALSTTFTVAGTSGSTPVSGGSTLTFSSTNGVTIAVDATYANISTPQDVRSTANPTFNNLTTASVQGVIGNVTPAAATFTTGTFNTATTGGLQAVAIGNVTPGTGAFTTLTASSITQVTNGTESTTSTSGALQVTGGVGIAKNLNVGGDVVVTGNLTVNGDVTTVNAATLDVEDLNITVAKGAASAAAANGGGLTVDGAGATLTYASADDSWNVNKLLNINDSTGSTSTSTGALVVDGGAGIAGNLNVGGLIQAGTASFASINNTPIGNATPSTGAFTTLTAQTETVGGLQAVAIGNVTPGSGAFTSLAVQQGIQNIPIGNATPSTGAFTTLSASGITQVTNNTTSTSTSSGALVVTGGVGVGENVYVGGTVYVGESVIGASTINTGTLTAGTGNLSYLNVGGNSALNTVTAASLQAVAIGNVTPGTGAFTSVSSSTTYTLNTGTAASLQATAIGNVTPGTGAFTTLTAQTETVGGLQAVAIGNVTPGTGAFTTLSTSGVFTVGGNLVAAATTPSTTVSTGSLITKGGAGIDGNLNVGTYGTNYHAIRGNVLIGDGSATPSALDSLLTLNENSSSPLPNSAFTIHVSAKDARHGVVGVDSFGTGVVSSFIGRHARGTAASPTAAQNGDQLGAVMFKGYGASTFASGNGAGIYAIAKENFTDSAMGTGLTIRTIPTGSTTADDVVYIGTDGNVLLKSTTPSTSANTGALVVAGGAGIAGNLYVTNDIRTTSGSAFIGNAALINGIVRISDTTDTTASGTGSFYTAGGASIAGNLHTGTNLYVGNNAFNLPMTTPTIIAVDNGTQYAQVSMTNSSRYGSADYAAYASDYQGASYDHGWADIGFTGNSFADSTYTITGPHDAYLFGSGWNGGGNLVLATDYTGTHNDILIGVGSFHANAEVVRFHGNASTSGTMVVKLPTNATAANTGALQVWGGTSISGNVWLDNALTVNGSKTATNNVVFKGKTDETLLWSRAASAYDQIVIGGNAVVGDLVRGAKLQINSTDSILLPTGTTGDRPGSTGGTDTIGMFRYNTTLGAVEWYTGATWQTATTTFTVITDEQFNGDGTNLDFALAAATTTSSTIVSINGVIQIPTLAYSITGSNNDVLTFTEAPASGDVIDVRRLVTTSTLLGVASPNGKNAFQTDNNGVYIYTGTSASRVTTSWNTSGNEISNVANVTVSTANTATTIVTMDASLYRSGKFVVQATAGTDYQVMEALVVHDGTTASVMAYGVVQTNGNLGVLSATYTSGNVLLQFVSSNISTIVRTKSDFLTI